MKILFSKTSIIIDTSSVILNTWNKIAFTKKWMCMCFCALLVCGCSKDDETQESILSLNRESIIFTPKSTEYQTVEVTSNINWTVSVTQTDNWLSVTPVSGKGDGVINFTAVENVSTEDRAATVAISGEGVTAKNITVTQAGADAMLAVSADSIRFTSAPTESQSINITSNLVWNVSIIQTGDWLSVSPVSGNENGRINFTATENVTTVKRMATVAISAEGVTTKNMTVTQAGADPTLILSSENIVFKAIPSSPQIIKIKSNIQWHAEIEQPDDWLTITPAFDNGNDSLAISAKPNPGMERIASVIISGEGISDRVIQVTQSIPAEGENKPPLVDFDFEDMIDRYVLTNKSTDRDGDVLVSKWESSNSNIVFNGGVNPYFLLPYTVGNNTADITLTVTDGIYTVSTTKAVPIPETAWYRVYGMAKAIRTSVANDVKYDWFIDQNKTGIHSNVNCGPTSVTMALKWVYPDFNRTVEDARNTYYPEGGWWYTNNIIDYLNLCGVSGTIIPFGINKSADLMAELDNGNIAILCLDMYYIRNETKGIEWPVDKFYYTDRVDWGHFIVVKGYKIADKHILFEVYDPASSMTYSDGRYMGKDRLYRSEDIMKSTDIWWKYAIIVHPQSQLRKGERIPFNRDNIPNQKGR